MGVHLVRHLPVINDGQVEAIVSDLDIVNNDLDAAISTYRLATRAAVARHNEHIFEVMDRMAEFGLTAIPVIDDKGKYIGTITQEGLLEHFTSTFSFEEPGSIIVIETDRANYSMVEIAKIVEEEQAAILTSMLSFDGNSSRVSVTLKLNKQDIGRIIASFTRYDYTIRGTFSESEYIDALQERYDSLMHYLNV